MKFITRCFDMPQIRIVNIGDVHYGSPDCDRGGLEKIVNIVRTQNDLYWISTGDLLNVYKSQSLQDELENITEILSPISKKCLGVVGSNHHDRLEKRIGLNLDLLLANWLDIPYLGYFGFLRVILNGIGFYICMHHSFGFGRTDGAKANVLARMGVMIKGFDLYMTGHTHSYMHFVDSDYVLDRKHHKVMNMITYYVCTGHFINYEGSYGEKMPLKAKPKCCAVVTLKSNGVGKYKSIEVGKIDI